MILTVYVPVSPVRMCGNFMGNCGCVPKVEHYVKECDNSMYVDIDRSNPDKLNAIIRETQGTGVIIPLGDINAGTLIRIGFERITSEGKAELRVHTGPFDYCNGMQGGSVARISVGELQSLITSLQVMVEDALALEAKVAPFITKE